MPDQSWDKTLMLETRRPGHAVTINSTERATRFLLHEWPKDQTGEAFEAAKKALLEAYEGKIGPDEARDAVIAAAREDGVFVYSK